MHVRGMYMVVSACYNRKMSSPAITTKSNANLSATNTLRAGRTRRRRLQRCTWTRVALYKRVQPKTRCRPSWRGRTESASGISLGSTDAPTARSWTSKMESNVPCDESGWIDENTDCADRGRRGKGRRRQPVPEWSRADIFIHKASPHGCAVSGLQTRPARTHRTWDTGEMRSYREPLLGRTDEWTWKLRMINGSLCILLNPFLISSEILFIKILPESSELLTFKLYLEDRIG